ncbi:MAG: sigma-54-dependent Fis family transcriptional regulator [Planctomycetes bacterium]|nr:sigma-54-dependent Fis family transcriptional regulator [Planctomycetota bacterium]
MTATEPSTAPLRVLVADDEESMRHFLQRGLRRLGYEVDAVADGNAAVAAWLRTPYDLGVLDVRMPGIDGVAALGRIRSSDPEGLVVLMTAHGTIATAVEAMQLGAADFVTKPFTIDELEVRLRRAFGLRAATRENRQLRSLLDGPDQGLGLIARSPAMVALTQQIDLLAQSVATVLIGGESGTGKGLVAEALHLRSERRQGPFVTLNCAAVPDNLVESELFGHAAGAFTGATRSKPGLLLRANRGTLFLDEIGDMSPAAQAKIERFLQDREFLPLGSQQEIRVDTRIVAATNRDLHELVRAGLFRQELLWRLDVLSVAVPPLRERREDIPLLIARNLERLAAKGLPPRSITPEALGALTAYDWPGNVRELENAIERMVALSGERTALGVPDLPTEVRGPGDEVSREGDDNYEAARRRFDRLYFTNLLVRTGGSITEAARLAGISRGHLHRRLKELDCDVAATRDASRGNPRP